MTEFRNWAIKELRSYSGLKFSEQHILQEMETFKAEISAIKASSYDKMPSATGENFTEEKILNVLSRADEQEKNLEMTRRKIADIERLLDQMPQEERNILQRTIMENRKHAYDDLADEMHVDVRQIYRKRAQAIDTYARLKFGAGYRP